MKIVRLLIIVVLAALVVTACAQDSVDTGNTNEGTKEDTKTKIVSPEEAAKTALKNGDKMPEFELPNPQKKTINSNELLKESNLVVVFYRGGWCPFCNLYLKQLQENVDGIKDAGGQLVAISAENPDDSLTTEQKNKLAFHVLSDKNLDFARKFGLVYQLDKDTETKYKSMDIDLVVDNDMDKPELPISATYIVNQSGEIVFSFVDPDYKKRLEPETIIAELKKIKKTDTK